MDSDQFVKRIRELTEFDRERAALLARTTLVTLGTRISPEEADDLAAQLPRSFAACLQHESAACRFGPDEFKRRVARILPLANDQAGPAVKAVFHVLSDAVSGGELRHVLRQLSADYEPLVGMTTGQAASLPSGVSEHSQA